MAAEKVTGWFTTAEPGDDVKTTEVLAAPTVSANVLAQDAGEMQLVKFGSALV
jgi:hypothetical protein